jgi:hypothetical protein
VCVWQKIETNMNSALRVRKALRKFLLKTHPDFFESGDAVKKAANAQALALINVLVDGATTGDRQSVRLPPVLRLTAHYRAGLEQEQPFRFQLPVPASLERASTEAVRSFCSQALLQLLVEAGEAQPEDTGWEREAKRDEWVVMAGMDAEGLQRAMFNTFMRDPPRDPREHSGARTDAEMARKVHEARRNYWLERTMMHAALKLFESEAALATLRQMADHNSALLTRLCDLPLLVVPPTWFEATRAPPGTLVARSDEGADGMARRLAEQEPFVREQRALVQRGLRAVLACCDVVTERGRLVGLSLPPELMRASASAKDRLIQLLESPLLPLLYGCAVSLSVMEGERPAWALRAKYLTVVDSETVPLVEVAVGDGPLSGFDALRASYAVAHARRRCDAINDLSKLSENCRVRLRKDFHGHSLTQQIAAVRGVAQLIEEVQPPGSPEARMNVRIGAPGQSVQLRDDGTLELPMRFTFENVKAALLKQ